MEDGPFRMQDGMATVARFARRWADSNPEASASELVHAIEAAVALSTDRQNSTCRYCDQSIIESPGGRWVHDVESYARGCRAASFDRLGTWDDSLPRARNAAPRS